MPICFLHICWAWKNRAFGPLRADAGVVTFLPGYSGMVKVAVWEGPRQATTGSSGCI